MGRARVVTPPPRDYIPEPLISSPIEIIDAQEELEKTQALELVKTLEKQLADQKDATEKAEKKLANEKDAAAKVREEQILKNRQQATARGKNQLNIVTARKPSISNRIKSFLKQRRIKKATLIHNVDYGQALIHNAGILIPKMLDDMETMHERLAILEELLVKYEQHQKN